MAEAPKVAVIGTGLIGCAWAVSFASRNSRLITLMKHLRDDAQRLCD